MNNPPYTRFDNSSAIAGSRSFNYLELYGSDWLTG